MKNLLIAVVSAVILGAPAAFAQEKPAKSATTSTAVKDAKTKGKSDKHHVMAKKKEVKKTAKKS